MSTDTDKKDLMPTLIPHNLEEARDYFINAARDNAQKAYSLKHNNPEVAYDFLVSAVTCWECAEAIKEHAATQFQETI